MISTQTRILAFERPSLGQRRRPRQLLLYRPIVNEAAARAKLSILARATGDVALGPVGAAAAVTPELQAYRELASEPALLAALRSELEELSRTGPGARRVYASLMLSRSSRD